MDQVIIEETLALYKKSAEIDINTFLHGRGKHKTNEQRRYEELSSYRNRLKAYANHIQICSEDRNSYSKTDHDAKHYATDMECFVPLMEKFNALYGHYAKYPVADAGYGSYNNYIYCEEHGMEKFMKFTMFEKKTINNLESIHGALLCMNRSIQAEGTFGVI